MIRARDPKGRWHGWPQQVGLQRGPLSGKARQALGPEAGAGTGTGTGAGAGTVAGMVSGTVAGAGAATEAGTRFPDLTASCLLPRLLWRLTAEATQPLCSLELRVCGAVGPLPVTYHATRLPRVFLLPLLLNLILLPALMDRMFRSSQCSPLKP